MVSTQAIKVTLLKSKYGRRANHQACLRGLGLRRIRQSVVVADTPENRGMIAKVSYLVKAEEI
ncbi:MAG: 50S ribosomal protein L30 [Gammaproteobacteria bacterium]